MASESTKVFFCLTTEYRDEAVRADSVVVDKYLFILIVLAEHVMKLLRPKMVLLLPKMALYLT